MQGVVDVERQLGGTVVDCSKHILFQFNAGNLCLSVDNIGYGWRLKQTTACQVRSDLLYRQHDFTNTALQVRD